MAKLSAGAAEGFLRNPDKKVRLVLFYGPDGGLARERLKKLCATIVEDLNDPFNVADLTSSRLIETPTLLAEEAAAISMMGGQRVVMVRDAGNQIAPIISSFLDDPVGDALICLVAGELAGSSKLRQTVEKSAFGMAIPCYLDSADAISQLIDTVFRQDTITIAPDARDYLVDHLGQDRGSSRGELEKLALYAGQGGRLELEDIRAAIGDSAAPELDDVVFSAFSGTPATLDKSLTQLFALGTSAIPILRAGASHSMRLRHVKSMVKAGRDVKSAMKSMRPPVFFKVEGRFSAQSRQWTEGALDQALALLLDAEADCKKTGAAEPLICSRTYHRIAVMALRHNQRR